MTYETTPKSNKKSSFLADFTLVLQLCLNRRSHKVFLAPQFKCVWDDFYFCTGTNPRYKPKVSSPLHIVHGGRFIMGWSRQRISAALQPNFQLGWVAEQALGTIHCVKTQLTFRLRHFLLSYLGNINYFLEEKNTNLKKKKIFQYDSSLDLLHWYTHEGTDNWFFWLSGDFSVCQVTTSNLLWFSPIHIPAFCINEY